MKVGKTDIVRVGQQLPASPRIFSRLAAVLKDRKAGEDGEMVETERILGVSRYVTNPDQSSCEFA